MATTRYGIKDNQVRAFNKLIRVSHQKLNLVCDTVRGLPVARAIDVLKFSKKANAEHNKNLPADSLFVKEIWCGKALTMKRIMPASQGRARPILKPFSNLTIVLESGVAPTKKVAKKTTTKEKAK